MRPRLFPSYAGRVCRRTAGIRLSSSVVLELQPLLSSPSMRSGLTTQPKHQQQTQARYSDLFLRALQTHPRRRLPPMQKMHLCSLFSHVDFTTVRARTHGCHGPRAWCRIGPFEQKMTRREAALILGVRESASAGRIKEAHRRILRINHPDMGGST